MSLKYGAFLRLVLVDTSQDPALVRDRSPLDLARRRRAHQRFSAGGLLCNQCVTLCLTVVSECGGVGVPSREVDACGDVTHTLQQSTTLKADTMRASDKIDSCNIRAALQILKTSVRAPQNTQTAAEGHSLVAVDTDEHKIARIKLQCAANKQAAAKFSPPPAKLVK